METQQSPETFSQEPTLLAAFHQPSSEEKLLRRVSSSQTGIYVIGIVISIFSLFFGAFFKSNLNPLEQSIILLLALCLFLVGILFVCVGIYNDTALKRGKKQLAKNPLLYKNDTYTYFYNTHIHIDQSGPLTTYASNLPYSDILTVTETTSVIQIRTSTGFYTAFKEDMTYGNINSLTVLLKSMLPTSSYQKA